MRYPEPAAATRTFYRIVRADPPTVDDFRSVRALGKRPPRDEEHLRLWDGLSVYRTETQARKKARSSPLLGMYIAELQMPADAPVRLERTLKNSAGHHTLWGEPVLLLAYVTRVVPV